MTRQRPRSERASDAEREAAVEQLRIHAVAGRLDQDELAMRAESAYRARTIGELQDVLRDLPPARSVLRPIIDRRPRWISPALATVTGAGATVAVSILDHGFRGPFNGVAAVPFWATIATGSLLAARVVAARVRLAARSRNA